jgi:cbb3-type cytochrome oxidase subunit 1
LSASTSRPASSSSRPVSLIGGYVIVGEFVFNRFPPRLFITAHVHLLLVGFMLMVVMGVATWMFPRPARDDARYRPELAMGVYWVMTISTALRAAAEMTAPFTSTVAPRLLIAVGGIGQLVGALLFVVNMWPRVRMPVAPPPPSR